MSSDRLKQLFRVIEEEMKTNPAFAQRMDAALKGLSSQKPGSKRQAPLIDPQGICAERGESGLREVLIFLETDQLKDVISAYGMDPSRLAMKWSNRERLIEHIVTTSLARSKKGDAFRA